MRSRTSASNSVSIARGRRCRQFGCPQGGPGRFGCVSNASRSSSGRIASGDGLRATYASISATGGESAGGQGAGRRAACFLQRSPQRRAFGGACSMRGDDVGIDGGRRGGGAGFRGGVVLAEVAARGTVSSCSCSVNASGRIRASASSDCCAASAAIRRQARSTPRHQPATVGRSCVDGIAIASRSHADGGRKAPPASRSNHSTRIPAMPCAPSRSRKPAGTVPRSSPIASAR